MQPEKKILKRTYTLSPIEFYRFQLDQIINSKYDILNSTQITILAYIKVYGLKASDMILKDRILTSYNSVKNYFTWLNSKGYIFKEQGEKKNTYINIGVNPKIKLEDSDFVQLTEIKLNAESEEVYHPNFRK